MAFDSGFVVGFSVQDFKVFYMNQATIQPYRALKPSIRVFEVLADSAKSPRLCG